MYKIARRLSRAFRLPWVLVLACAGTLSSAGAPSGAGDNSTTRIVSLVPALTATLFALGAEAQVVGVSDYCEQPAQTRTRPRVGGLLNPELERIVMLRPDLVLLYKTQEQIAARLQALGIKTRLLEADSLKDVFANLAAVGRITGTQKRARALAEQIRQRLESVRRRADRGARPRVLVVVSRDPLELKNIYASTSSHYIGELVEIAGGENVLPKGSPAAVSKEQIVRLDPEVILDLSLAEGTDPAGGRGSMGVWDQLGSVRAVRDGRVHAVSDAQALVPGPAAAQTASRLGDILHPDRNPR